MKLKNDSNRLPRTTCKLFADHRWSVDHRLGTTAILPIFPIFSLKPLPPPTTTRFTGSWAVFKRAFWNKAVPKTAVCKTAWKQNRGCCFRVSQYSAISQNSGSLNSVSHNSVSLNSDSENSDFLNSFFVNKRFPEQRLILCYAVICVDSQAS